MSGRTRNPRVVAVEKMRQMRGLLARSVARGTPSRTVYIPVTARGAVGSTRTRPRRPDEYPENQAGYWWGLLVQMDAVAGLATEVRELARARYHATLAEHPEGVRP